ncbi:MAG: prolyl oligopeptidase family serine peptidase [Planctomycetota bacterium]
MSVARWGPWATAAAGALFATLACAPMRSSVGSGARFRAPQPETPRVTLHETLHGEAIDDPFRWLEDAAAPEVRAWVAREAALTRSVLDAAPLRAALGARLAQLSRQPTRSAPVRAGDWYYWAWNDGTQNQPSIVRGRSAEAHDEVVLDPNLWSTDRAETLAGWVPSPLGTYLAFGVAEGGSDWRTWRVLDLESLEVLPDRVPWVRFNAPAWSNDERGFYYGAYPGADEPLRPTSARMTLRHHELGAPAERDPIVHEEPLHAGRSFAPAVSDDGRWLIISVFEGADPRNRLYVRDLSRPDAPLIRVFDAFDAEYEVIANEGALFWLRTTNAAPNGRIVAVDVSAQERADAAGWTEVVPTSSQPLISAARVGETLVVEHLVDLTSRLDVYDLRAAREADGSAPDPIATDVFPGRGTVTLTRPRGDASALYFSYTDTLTPLEIWRFDARGPQRVFAPESAFDRRRYATALRFVASADGTQVPALLTCALDTAHDGETPALLYGYGGFNVPVRPVFTPAVAAWLELGGLYVTAHVRGGGEYGEEWHQAGVLERKPRAIEDFLAVARWLARERWTRPARLAIRGESNGGLLVGAALVREPGDFGAAISTVGVHDMLRYHRFGVGWAWASDYGTADDAALFPVLKSYSPYHNVKRGTRYPATLVATATGDDRVAPLHSYKFAAALREANGGEPPVFLRVEQSGGHAGGNGAARRLEATLDELCFLSLALDVDQAAWAQQLAARAQ